MNSKSPKGQVEVNSTTIIIILGLIMAVLVILFFVNTNSGFLTKSTGMFKSLSDCGKCIPENGLVKCLPLCWLL
ncbi:MAG: hypothetical protein ABIF85_06460 [Nanoarchaeota archaeon]|nr:hypothetical protein [Nanoarchaeota archaeon]MBU4300509.1 hypothetical protein [Nanoarchaeota archaeon]MBU4451989.1 hypothetical protein [Nanoarchaeota archaeon]MCG2724149.1 hypothetical protein [archaeon]